LPPLAPLRNPGQSGPQPDHPQCEESRLRKYSQNDRVHIETSNQGSAERFTIRYSGSPVAGTEKQNPNAKQTNC
jgi:hypothetical protein